ncbi:MAG TPA: hypothetical protein VGB76_20735 [Pyrinomonadaceae bacterium]
MAAELRSYEPREIATGETPQWTKSFDDYPASDGWALNYYFRGPGAGFDVAATADGDDFIAAVPAGATDALTPGAYFWQAWVSKDTEKYQVGDGAVTVKQGFAAVTTAMTVDNRSKAKRIIDAIDATLEGRATTDQHMYMIGNRQLMRIPVEQLISLRGHYATIYGEELRQARARRGGTLFKTLKVRFTKPK